VAAAAPQEKVSEAAIGISFIADKVNSVLPPVPADQLLLPPPYELRVLPQPQRRGKRRPLTNFTVWTMLLPEGEAIKPGDDATASSAANTRTQSPVGDQEAYSRPLSSRSGAGDVGAASSAVAKSSTPRSKNIKEVVSSSKPSAVDPGSLEAGEDVDMNRYAGLQVSLKHWEACC
jgi:hypothetical protein